jgi:Holliday junction resolvasome RuvABC ATP-dependent DNA helicase subunit
VVKQYLLQIVILWRAKRGVEVTKQACKHLGLNIHKKKCTGDQPEQFEQGEQ